jgi:mevalonate kinase
VGVGEGFGKLLLFGEHSAVYGRPAVGTAIGRSVTVTVTPGGKGRRADGLDSDDRSRLLELFRFIDRLRLPFALPADFDVSITSSVPRASGLGSSSALAVALVRALAPGLDEREVWRSANAIERYFHGTPSGIDTGLALAAGVRALYPDPPDIPESVSLPGIPLHLVVGTVRREGSTKSLVAALRARVESGEPEALAAIDALGKDAEEAISILSGGGTAASLASLADSAHATLRTLGLSTPLLEESLREGRDAGALGGKLSGAGGGGAFYLIAPDRPTAHRCALRLAATASRNRTPRRVHGIFALVDGKAIDLS